MTPRDALDAWLTALAVKGRRDNTIRLYRQGVGHWIGYCEVEGLDPYAVDRLIFRAYMATVKLAPEGVYFRVSTCKAWYSWLAKKGIAPDCLRSYTRPPKRRGGKPRRLPGVLGVGEIERLLSLPDRSTPLGLRDRAMLEVLYGSGLRASELVALDLGDLDLRRRTLEVRGGKTGARTVLFGEACARALEDHLLDARPVLDKGGEAALWLNYRGQRLTIWGLDRIVQEYGRQLGRRIHPHMLRHSYATHLMDGGADLRMIQDTLGHNDVSSTAVYLHTSRESQAKSSDAAWRTLERRKLLR